MMKTNLSLWWSLLNPTVAGQLFVWLVRVRLYGFMFKDWLYPSCLYFFPSVFYVLFFFLVDVLPSLTCPFVVPRMAQTVWLMDTLLVWFINPSMSWPACPVTVHQCVPEYLCPSCTCLFRHWCNQLKPAKTGSEVTPPSWTSVRHNCFLMIPQSKGHSVRGVKKVKTFSRVVSSTSLCLLNLRASIDFHWERKKNSQRET